MNADQRRTLTVLNEMLVDLEHEMVVLVVDRVDHPLLPALREAYLSVQNAYNVVDKVSVDGSWNTVSGAGDPMAPPCPT